MLWYKAWLETRWRFIFMLATIAVMWVPDLLGLPSQRLAIALRLAAVLQFSVTALFLAGAGINTQTFYAATTGYHGSMLFTLSLPVSRRRLFLVRAGLGALETWVFIAVLVSVMVLRAPQALSSAEALRYAARAMICIMAVYSLSALLACFLDEMWQFMSSALVLGALAALMSRSSLVAQFSPLRGLTVYPAHATMPWAPVMASIVITVVLVCSSLLVLRRKEF
jgi:hypothetical protein